MLGKGPVDADKSVSEALKGETVWIEDCSSDSRVQYPEAAATEGIAKNPSASPPKTFSRALSSNSARTPSSRPAASDQSASQ